MLPCSSSECNHLFLQRLLTRLRIPMLLLIHEQITCCNCSWAVPYSISTSTKVTQDDSRRGWYWSTTKFLGERVTLDRCTRPGSLSWGKPGLHRGWCRHALSAWRHNTFLDCCQGGSCYMCPTCRTGLCFLYATRL